MKKATELFEDLRVLEAKILDSFNTLSKGTHYFCEEEFIKDTLEDTFEELKEYGDIQDLEQIYYNVNGYERMGYLIAVIDSEIILVDNDSWDITYERLTEINLLNDKINIVYNLENL